MIDKLKSYFKLMRPQQWFKSFSLLFGISVAIFMNNVTNVVPITILSLIAVSLMSSTIYIFNDIADVKKDRIHPIKKKRPIASKKISIIEAVILGVILLILSLSLLYYLKPMLLLIGALFVFNNLLYSFKPFRLKDIPIVDVFCAALNFSLRVLIGWYALSNIIPFKVVVLFPFFIAGFLLSCKRIAEYNYLGKKAVKHKTVFKYYSQNTLYLSVNVYLVLCVISYFFFSNIFNRWLFLIGPWFFLQMYWYKSFLKDNNSVVKRPEDVFLKKKKFSILGTLFCLSWLLIVLFT